MKQITITKVVSKHIFGDFFSTIRNFFGYNLIAYEEMVNKGMKQIEDELFEKQILLEWYRYEITELTNGAISITLYGDRK